MDVSLAGSNWSNKCIWSTGDQIGKSDHLPITIAITTTVQHQTVFGRKARWRRNGINWNAFREEIEEETSNLPSEPNITQQVIRLNSIIIEAAHYHVGRPNQARAPDHTSLLPSVQHYGNVTDCGGSSEQTGRSGSKRVAKPTKRLKNPRKKHGAIYYPTLPPMLTPKKCGV